MPHVSTESAARSCLRLMGSRVSLLMQRDVMPVSQPA
jgi:hypothetical protein